MEIYQAIVLGAVQGLTEFLPISSSAHLVLLSNFFAIKDNLTFDVIVHFATLLAVVFYYRKDLVNMAYAFFTDNRISNPDTLLTWGIIIATVPIVFFGALFRDIIENNLRNIEIIAYMTIFFAVLLYIAHYIHSKKAKLRNNITIPSIVMIGLFQTLALVPGVSRSGITLTIGLMLGLRYPLLLKFVFLLAIPTIFIAMGVISLDLIKSPEAVAVLPLLVGFITAFLCAYIVICFFIKVVEMIGIIPFVIYRLLLGFFILTLL